MSNTLWTVECITSTADLSKLQSEWDRLAANRRMCSYAWASSWLGTIGRETTPRVLVAKCDGIIKGILPLALEWTLLRGRRLIMIGSKKACGDDLGLLADSADCEKASQTITDWLYRGTGRSQWDFLDLDGIQPESPTSCALLASLSNCDQLLIEKRPSPSIWSITLPETWGEYTASLSKRMRKIIRDQERELLTTGRARLEVATSLDEARSQLQSIAELHQSRWNERCIDGCFGTDGFRTFLELLLEAWWEEGTAYVATLQLDGKAVAGAYGFWTPDELAIYLVGMDLATQEHRPGWMLNAECVRLAQRLNRRRVNFLRGDEEYKARLGAVPTCQERYVITSSRALPRLRHKAIMTGIEIRNWMRSRTATNQETSVS